MKKEKKLIENIPAVLYGSESDKLYIFVHGKDSNKEEAASFAEMAVKLGYQVLSFDLPEHGEREKAQYKLTVQNAVHDLDLIYNNVKEKYEIFSLYACSIGAYFSLLAYQDIRLDNCLFISPILDMEKLIQNMMTWAGVTEEELSEKKEIETSFGEVLSWDYYQYVKAHPIERWNKKTFILYGGNDNLTEISVLDSFKEKFNCKVDILDGGEHYFHTAEQVEYLFNWLGRVLE